MDFPNDQRIDIDDNIVIYRRKKRDGSISPIWHVELKLPNSPIVKRLSTDSTDKKSAIISAKKTYQELFDKVQYMTKNDASHYLFGGHNTDDILFLMKLIKEKKLQYKKISGEFWIDFQSLEKCKNYLPTRLKRMWQSREVKPDFNGVIYFIQMGTNPIFKIGITSEEIFESRLSSLQTGNPHKLKCLFRWETPSVKQDEKMIHNLLDKYKMDGGTEWFECEKNILLETIDPITSRLIQIFPKIRK